MFIFCLNNLWLICLPWFCFNHYLLIFKIHFLIIFQWFKQLLVCFWRFLKVESYFFFVLLHVDLLNDPMFRGLSRVLPVLPAHYVHNSIDLISLKVKIIEYFKRRLLP